MRNRTRAAAAALLIGCIVPAPGTATAVARPAMPYDFNGDGYADLTVGVPFEDVGARQWAGIVQVLYGSTSGATAHDQIWHQGRPGVKGAVERDDRFGHVHASGDFDGDGFADLAIGIPNESIGTAPGTGAVQVLYGSSTGLTARDQIWHQGKPGVPGSNEAGDWFGSRLAVGDFEGDGFADLAIGVPQEDVGALRDAGRVVVLRGTAGGLSATGAQLWGQGTSGLTSDPRRGEGFGSELVAGDINGDDRDDLVIRVGAENDTRPPAWDDDDLGSALHVLFGTAQGLSPTGSQFVTPALLGETQEPTSQFVTLGLNDLNSDGRADLTMGTRRGIAVLHGTPTGLPLVALGPVGGPGTDGLLSAIAMGDPTVGDLTGDGHPDLVYSSGDDTIDILLGTSSGLGARTVRWAVPLGGRSVQQLSGTGAGWLVIGRPSDPVSGRLAAGMVSCLRAGPDLRLTTSVTWHQDSPGIKGAAETEDLWGFALG